jgi:hypothetical protein
MYTVKYSNAQKLFISKEKRFCSGNLLVNVYVLEYVRSKYTTLSKGLNFALVHTYNTEAEFMNIQFR